VQGHHVACRNTAEAAETLNSKQLQKRHILRLQQQQVPVMMRSSSNHSMQRNLRMATMPLLFLMLLQNVMKLGHNKRAALPEPLSGTKVPVR
jgi:hypothetical protein